MRGKTKVRILHLRENLQKKFNYICFKQIIQKPNRGQLQQLFPSFMAGEYTSRQIEKEMVHIYVMLLLKQGVVKQFFSNHKEHTRAKTSVGGQAGKLCFTSTSVLFQVTERQRNLVLIDITLFPKVHIDNIKIKSNFS